MIQFQSVMIYEIDMTLKRPVIAAHGVIKSKRVLLLKWISTMGIVWSEAGVLSEPTYHYETIDTVVMVLKQWILPLILNKKYYHPSEISMDLDSRIQGHFCAKATVEMAAWNVLSIYQNNPLAVTLGGRSQYAVAGAVLGGASIHEILDDASDCVALGYRRIKLKISPTQDSDIIKLVREVIPENVQFTVDANGSYTSENIMQLSPMNSLGISVFEQPFHRDDLELNLVLQTSMTIPICLDESAKSLKHIETAIALNACHGVAIKPGRLGGIGPSIAVYHRMKEVGQHTLIGGMFETSIGRAYLLALHSVFQDTWIGDLSPSGRYWQHDLCAEPDLLLDNGTIAINTNRIGSGVIPDERLIHRLSANKEMIAK